MSCSTTYDWDPRVAHDDESPQQFAGPGTETKVDLLVSPGRGGKRSRQTYSKYQTAVLETVFQTSKYIVRSKRQQMSAELSLTERQIKIWFQNRRMKEKKCGSGGHHQDGALADDRDSAVTGYVDDFAVSELGVDYHAAPQLPGCDLGVDPHEDAFVDFCHSPAVRHRPPPPPPQIHDAGVGYAGYGGCDVAGYDLLTHHNAHPYAAEVKHQPLWTPATNVDYDQDFFGDHDLDHFQRLSTAHHHHHHHRPLMNSQVQDYCPPQLQAAHGY